MANTFKSYGSNATGTALATVYTTPVATTATVIGLSVANVSGATITVDIKISKAGIETYLIKGAPISVGGSLVAVGGDQKLVLEAGNLIRVASSAAASIDVITSVLEAS